MRYPTRCAPATPLASETREFQLVARPQDGLWNVVHRAVLVVLLGKLGARLLMSHSDSSPLQMGFIAIMVMTAVILGWIKECGKAIRLSVDRDEIRAFSHGGIKLWEIAYRELRRVEIGGEKVWLTLFTETGERKIDRFRFSERDDKTIQFIRMLHAANPNAEVIWRRKRTLNEFERFVEERHFEFPPVRMQEGVTYRYIKEARGRDFKILNQIFNGFLGFALFALVQRNGITILAGSLFVGLPFLFYMYPAQQMRLSGSDRFEVTSEGLKVRRKDQTWLLRNPRPSKRSSTWIPGLKGGVLRYRHGWGGYYFDPRLIEEDV